MQVHDSWRKTFLNVELHDNVELLRCSEYVNISLVIVLLFTLLLRKWCVKLRNGRGLFTFSACNSRIMRIFIVKYFYLYKVTLARKNDSLEHNHKNTHANVTK